MAFAYPRKRQLYSISPRFALAAERTRKGERKESAEESELKQKKIRRGTYDTSGSRPTNGQIKELANRFGGQVHVVGHIWSRVRTILGGGLPFLNGKSGRLCSKVKSILRSVTFLRDPFR
jgi:hypothetical protein